MAFREKVIKAIELLSERPVFRETVVSEEEVEVKKLDEETGIRTTETRIVKVPRVHVLESDPKARAQARRAFRKKSFAQLNKLPEDVGFKMSVLVRSVRSGDVSILDMAKATRKNDRTFKRATHEELSAGLALADKQGVSLDSDWSKK